MTMPGRLYIMTGPSGVGKTSVAQELLKVNQRLRKVVTCTTRPMRSEETDGVSYNFLTQDQFQKLLAQDAFFESDKHYGHFYGSRKSDVKNLLTNNLDVLFVLDVSGARTVKRLHPEAVTIFLTTHSLQELTDRLEQRRSQGDSVGFEERKQAIEREMAFETDADYTIINDTGKLQETVKDVITLMERLDAK